MSDDRIKILEEKIELYSAVVARMDLASRLGMSYDNDRDLYEALGYKTTLVFDDYLALYNRLDIAKAVIDRPVGATWSGGINVYEVDDKKDTSFEKEWKNIYTSLNLKNKFTRLDRITGIGEYAVLLLGTNDIENSESFKTELAKKSKLLYVRPVTQKNAQIDKYVTNSKDPRYGLPLTYKITISEPSNESEKTIDLEVHHSRVVHINENQLESEILGTPRLKPIFNRLKDIEKLVGGSAEMFWRGARPGYGAEVDKDFQMTDDVFEELKTQLNEFEHNLRRILTLEGIKMNPLSMQVSDPNGHFNIQIQCISAETGIPKRILTGSERGELSSSQDRNEWLTLINNRRGEFAEPKIIRPFIDKCIKYEILSKPTNDYYVEWEDIFSPSEKEKAEIGKIRSQSIKDYISQSGSEFVLPKDMFYKYILNLSDEEIEMIKSFNEPIDI